MSNEHELKITTDLFQKLCSGRSNIICRVNDRVYTPGDYLVLREWISVEEKYTGNCIRTTINDVRIVDDALHGSNGSAILSVDNTRIESDNSPLLLDLSKIPDSPADRMQIGGCEWLDWNQLSALGLIKRINREILHPLGFAMFRDTESGASLGAMIANDGVWIYGDESGDKS